MPARIHIFPVDPYDATPKPTDNVITSSSNLREPFPAIMFQSYFNYIVDSLDQLSLDIQEVTAGNIPGTDDIDNANKFLKTDGQGNLLFDTVGASSLDPQSITQDKYGLLSIGEPQLQSACVTEPKHGALSVSTRVLQNACVTEPKLGLLSVSTQVLQDKCATEPKLGDLSVSTRVLQNACVTEPKLGLLSVSTQVLQNACVTEPKLGLLSVSTQVLQNKCATEPKLGDLSVSTRVLQNACVDTDKIGDNAITEIKNADSSTSTRVLQDRCVTPVKLSTDIHTAFAFVYCNSNGQIRKSFNVTSVLRNAVGTYTVTFTSQPSVNYVCVGSCLEPNGIGVFVSFTASVNSVQVFTYTVNRNTSITPFLVDSAFSLVVFV